MVEYEPRGGTAGVFDRVLLGIRHAFERTFVALEQELIRTSNDSDVLAGE